MVKTKQIICVSDWGAYCQGDSEFGSDYFFDAKGNAIFSSGGHNEYVDEHVYFYKNGIPTVEVIHPSAYGDLKIRTIRPAKPTDAVTTVPFVERVDELLETMKKRIKSLEKITNEHENIENQKEARNTIKELKANLFSTDSIANQYLKSGTIGFPIKGGNLLLKSNNVVVKKNPSIDADTIAYV